jgi:hypothetical protein
VDTTATPRFRRDSCSVSDAARRQPKEASMLRDVILWLAGVPIFVIILLHLFGVFH